MKVKDNLDFGEFLAEVGVAQMEFFASQTQCDVIYQLYSTISFCLHLSPKIFRKFSHSYICPDIYPENIQDAIIEVLFSPQWSFALLKFLKAFYWPFKRHKSSSLRHGRRVRRCYVTMHWNGGRVAGHHQPMHHMFSAQHTCAADFFL